VEKQKLHMRKKHCTWVDHTPQLKTQSTTLVDRNPQLETQPSTLVDRKKRLCSISDNILAENPPFVFDHWCFLTMLGGPTSA
jgi:hypothetical protein